MLYYCGIFLAQIQTSYVIAGLAVIVSVISAVISFGGLKLMKKQMIAENNEKMASKVYVSSVVSRVDVDITNVKNNFEGYKLEHNKTHDKESDTDKEFRKWMRQEVSYIRDDLRHIKKDKS